MKKVFLCLVCIGLMGVAAALQSCSDNESEVTNLAFPNALVTVKPNANNTYFVLQLNDSTTLWPVNMHQSPFGTKEVRALVNYRMPTDAELDVGGIDADMPCVYINWIDSIRTKPFINSLDSDEENQKKYGSDPLEIIDDWATGVEDGYLTLRFRTTWGSGKHIVNLVHRQDVNTPYYFSLYHDARGDKNGKMGDAIVAFKLDGIKIPQDRSETLTLEWLSYTGRKTIRLKFHHSED